jgi:hypothetical protein
MLTYDLQRYHPAFVIGVVDQVLEDIRRGMEVGFVLSHDDRNLRTVPAAKSLQIQSTESGDHEVSRRIVHLQTNQLRVDLRYIVVFGYVWSS